MSSTDELVRFVRETPSEDPSEVTSKRLGLDLPSYTGGRRWSLHQATRRLLDESSKEEEEDEVERSSPCEGLHPMGRGAPIIRGWTGSHAASVWLGSMTW
ncbi:UNVERIFIED_CONTAM: hypothetical protein Sradi_5878000 [Sesamum radiatum]|uniref:Uncharacterized protein n=1 Tax=Sesamum radiatum TaxID=300843 RepID=A0AAW2KRX6_SESRA